MNNKCGLFEFLGDKDVSKRLIDLKVDGLIFDHVAELKEEHSTTENLFVGKDYIDGMWESDNEADVRQKRDSFTVPRKLNLDTCVSIPHRVRMKTV